MVKKIEATSYKMFLQILDDSVGVGGSIDVAINNPEEEYSNQAIFENKLKLVGEAHLAILTKGEDAGTPLMLQRAIFDPKDEFVVRVPPVEDEFNPTMYDCIRDALSKACEINSKFVTDFPFDQYAQKMIEDGILIEVEDCDHEFLIKQDPDTKVQEITEGVLMQYLGDNVSLKGKGVKSWISSTKS